MSIDDINQRLDKFILSPTFRKDPIFECSIRHKYASEGNRELIYPRQPLKNTEKLALYNSDKKLKELSDILRVCPERARQIKFKAFLKLLYMKTHNIEAFYSFINEMDAILI